MYTIQNYNTSFHEETQAFVFQLSLVKTLGKLKQQKGKITGHRITKRSGHMRHCKIEYRRGILLFVVVLNLLFVVYFVRFFITVPKFYFHSHNSYLS